MKAVYPDQKSTKEIQNAIAGSATPDDLLIQSRNRHFASSAIENRFWAGGDPYATAFYNALSVTFPKGERFFMEALRHYRNDVPEKLGREIKAFCHQEAVHCREHACFNQQLTDSNYDLTKLEASINTVIDGIKARSAIDQLVATTCLEHITAILAKEFIIRPMHFEDADEEQRNLWLWHASEEIEHKGVAYDTWLHATRDWSRWQRWKTKTVFMLKISLGFAKNRTKGIMELLRQDGITGMRAWTGFMQYILLGSAPFRRTLLPWLQFFMPGFHPWNEDDRYLIQLAESEYEAAIMECPADSKHEKQTVTKLAERLKKIELPKVA